jgi:antirestriction protein ArdC
MRNLNSEITQRIIAEMRQGVAPWRKPWSERSTGFGTMPRNAVTHRAYSGINVPLLWIAQDDAGYAAPLWLTFKQALELGGNVRKGEKGTRTIFVTFLEKEDKAGNKTHVPMYREYVVFNVAQCENIDYWSEAKPRKSKAEMIQEAEDFLACTGADIRHGESRAYYAHAPRDYINLPVRDSFNSTNAYYATAFHELTHWTGAEHRLNRTKGKRFGDREYAFEELVAELGACFLAAEFEQDVEEPSTAYLENWIKVLEQHENMLASAASEASRAHEYLRELALTHEEKKAA